MSNLALISIKKNKKNTDFFACNFNFRKTTIKMVLVKCIHEKYFVNISGILVKCHEALAEVSMNNVVFLDQKSRHFER